MPYDIAVNITDPQYMGIYNSRKKHVCDISGVINRAKLHGVKMVFLGISLKSSFESIALANEYKEYCTIGIHPGSTETSSKEDVNGLIKVLDSGNIKDKRSFLHEDISGLVDDASLSHVDCIIGIGEIGLDYCRDYSPKEKQKEIFKEILDKTHRYNMPYIFHYRDCEEDFHEIIDQYKVAGVIHSYTGSLKEMEKLVSKGYYIGINGASIRENVHTSVIENIPLDKLLLETDAPWCTVRPTCTYHKHTHEYLKPSKKWVEDHPVKGRNEPVNLHQVIDIVAAIKNIERSRLVEIIDRNFKRLFHLQ
ncbi:hypothetical protein NERG_01390 [Nematocida ausubeli]|uniref:TatD DNase family protein n=1 Tax=Nematocida ausubeli (strain ATCC PRA-371 / ERTm2) TaxID=1913371 RepID=H8ZCE7_NEMA1|nr:hypothetical protein NERG_01390 [Nematocida ausubeli]